MNFNAPKHLVLFAFLAIGIVGCGVEEVETPVPTTNTTPTTSGTDNTTPDAPADTTPDSNNNTDTNTPNDDSNDGSNGNSNDTPASEPELMFMDCGDPEGNAEFEVEFDGTNLLADWERINFSDFM